MTCTIFAIARTPVRRARAHAAKSGAGARIGHAPHATRGRIKHAHAAASIERKARVALRCVALLHVA